MLRKGDAILAHACAWPICLATPTGTINAVQALDWAGARTSPGAGVAIMRKLESLAGVLITVGGSVETHQVLPRIGFAERGSIRLYARVLRPWKQFLTRPAEGSKGIPRLLRNTLWSRSALASGRGWTSQPASPDAEVLSALAAQTASQPESRYTVEFVNYMLRCPAARIQYFNLSKKNRPEGFFILSRVGGQVRLADLRILSREPEDWTSAYAVAMSAASQDPEACELLAAAPVPLVTTALESNGFRYRGSKPVFIRDPQGNLAGYDHIHLSMLDDDSAYLNFPDHPYST